MFADMYKPHVSGVTNYISLYKRRFEELGHEVWVFTFGNTDYADDEPNIVRSPAIPLGDTGWQMGLVLSSEAKRTIPALDIAHVHHPFLSGHVVREHCIEAGIPVVFTNHTRYDLYSDAYGWFLPKTMRYTALRRYLTEFTNDVDLVIAPSRGIQEWLAEFGVTEDTVHVPNCVDTEPFRNPRAPKRRTEFGFDEDSVVMCYLGRVSAEKNIDLLTEAFVRAAADSPAANLLVIGKGTASEEMRDELDEAGLRDRVHFAGTVPYSDVPDYLAAADVFVTASVSEVHPLVVLEAFAAGLPVVGVRSPGIVDTVDDDVNGLLASEDAEELAEHMSLMASDAELRARLAAGAAEAAARYDVRVIAEEMLALYRGLVERRTGSGAGL